VGVDNVISGRVIANKEGLLQIESAGSLIEAIGDYRQGSQVFVCLRPEDITLLPITAIDQASSARNRFEQQDHPDKFARAICSNSIRCGSSIDLPGYLSFCKGNGFENRRSGSSGL